MVRPAFLASALVLMGCRASAQGTGAELSWHVLADIPLPGKPARFDYQSLDPVAGTLLIAPMGAGQVLAFDVRARRVVARVPNMPGVTGVRVVPALGRVFATLSASHEVVVLDSRDGRVLSRIEGGRFPDGLAYVPSAAKLFVSDEFGRQELVIDVRRTRRAGPFRSVAKRAIASTTPQPRAFGWRSRRGTRS